MTKKAIIFDFDGVLIDSEKIAYLAWQDALKQAGINVSLSDLMSVGMGMSSSMILDWIYKKFHWKPDTDFLLSLRQRFENYFDEKALLEGVFDTLDLLENKKIPFALATNSEKNEMIFKLQKTNLEKYFSYAFTPEDVNGKAKPQPDIYIYTAKSLGFEPKDCIIIEDSPIGTRAGVSSGAEVWALTSTHHHEKIAIEQLYHGAKKIINNHKNLQKHILEVF